jgi:hypothetical protein
MNTSVTNSQLSGLKRANQTEEKIQCLNLKSLLECFQNAAKPKEQSQPSGRRNLGDDRGDRGGDGDRPKSLVLQRVQQVEQ